VLPPQTYQHASVCHKRMCPVLIGLICALDASAQDVPRSSAHPWHSEHERDFAQELQSVREQPYAMGADHTYTLGELVDIAESHNPVTRVAWQSAKAQAESLGIAKSALFPVISAVALARTSRQNTLYADGFYRDTIGLFQPAIDLNYVIFDFGGRSGAIKAARADMFAADFAFNDAHREIIYETAASYYRLLNAMGQQEAARATLLNAQTVREGHAVPAGSWTSYSSRSSRSAGGFSPSRLRPASRARRSTDCARRPCDNVGPAPRHAISGAEHQ
jgi:outer membrane protein